MSELHYQLDLLKAMNQKLTAKDKMYRMICDSTDCAYLYYSFEKNEVVTIGKWNELFNYEVSDIKGLSLIFDEVEEEFVMDLRDVIYLEKSSRVCEAIECKLKDQKKWYSFKTTVNYDSVGTPLDKLITIENITRSKSQKEELIYMAHFDTLTGLYNRNYFITLLHQYLERAEKESSLVSAMIIDIDDFKKVNDGMGMVSGDELIQNFGAFLKEFTNEHTIVGHLNNDVYCIAIYDPVGQNSTQEIYKRIKSRTESPFVLSNGSRVNISVSVGIAEYPEAATTALDLINCAEIVMFRCKTLGKDRVQYFDAPILNDFLNNIEMDNKLREATFNSNFSLHFQPQFHTGSKKLRGVEALIRWRDDLGHMISPGVFIPIAEKNGCIIPIGSWVVEQSIKIYSEWKEKYGVSFVMSINISAVQYNSAHFVDELMENIRKYKVSPHDIEIEITESVLIEDFDKIIEKLKVLRACGIRVSLDDFGTGFSSLSYLKKLPIDTLKIDKSFIDTVLTDGATRIITESIVSMVKSLGIESIAEGVETKAQYDYLDAIGCDMIQGFLLGKPQPAEEIEKLIIEGN